MKNLIKSSALLFALALLSTGALAASKVSTADATKQDAVSFTGLSHDRGFIVNIQKQAAGKSFVIIYDKSNNVVFKDILSKGAADVSKGYVLTNLEDGDYTVEVTSNKKVVKTLVHAYTDEGKQGYFFMQ